MSEPPLTTEFVPAPTSENDTNDQNVTLIQGVDNLSINYVPGKPATTMKFASPVQLSVTTASPLSRNTQDEATKVERSPHGAPDPTFVRPGTIPAIYNCNGTWDQASQNHTTAKSGSIWLHDPKSPDAAADFVTIKNPETGHIGLRAFVELEVEDEFDAAGHMIRVRRPLDTLGSVTYRVLPEEGGNREIFFGGISESAKMDHGTRRCTNWHEGPAVTSIPQPKGTAARLGLRQ
jgi:hypothetical protein